MSNASSEVNPLATPERWVALDWMRGLVMVLMALDHASLFFNSGRLSADSAAFYDGGFLPLGQFLTRWVTHLCAPTFVFLAGTSLALSTHRRATRGESARSIDRDLLIRGLLILGLEVVFTMGILAQRVILQVLYAIGLSFVCMIPLRRLPPAWLGALGCAWFVVGELLTALVWNPPQSPNTLVAVTVGVSVGRAFIMYPVIPWLCIMLLGWSFGHWLLREGASSPRIVAHLAWASAGLLLTFVVVRYLNGYGNLFLLRQDNSAAQWLHVSKYPPSLAYATLELGLMSGLLAFMVALSRRISANKNGVLLVFGQTALFFYLFHFAALRWGRTALALSPGQLGHAYVAAVIVLGLAYPLCRAYRTQKQRKPESWLRFV